MKKQVLFVSAVILSLTFASCGGEEKAPVVEEKTTTETTIETQTEVAPTTADAPIVVEEKKVVKKVTKIEPKKMDNEVKEGIVVSKANAKKPTNSAIEDGKIELQTIDKSTTEIKSRQKK